MKENFVFQVLIDEDGQFSAEKISMSQYGWVGHILAMGELDYLSKSTFVQEYDDEGEVFQDVAANMELFVNDVKDQFDELAIDGAVEKQAWDDMIGQLHRSMHGVDFDSVSVTAVAWSVEVDMCVTFLVSLRT